MQLIIYGQQALNKVCLRLNKNKDNIPQQLTVYLISHVYDVQHIIISDIEFIEKYNGVQGFNIDIYHDI